MLLALCLALARPTLLEAREVVLVELACVPLQAPHRNEGSIARGAAPDPDSLDLLSTVSILRSGRVLVSDSRDGAVHVFDESGARVALCVPPEPRSTWLGSLVGDHHGHVFMEAFHGAEPTEPLDVEFAPDGTFLDECPRPRDDDGELLEIQRWFSPFEDVRWTWRMDGSWRFERAGKVLRCWTRRPDGGPWRTGQGTWLGDGRFVVFDRYVSPPPSCFGFARPAGSPPDLRKFLLVFDADGAFIEQHLLPDTPVFGKLAGGARRVVFWGADDEWRLFDLDTHRRTTVRVEERADRLAEERRTWDVVVRPDGSEELWVVERRARRLLRYALP